ncbi:MAG: M48 family metallopeptidase, partial [Nitrospirales bacterium]
QMGTESFEQMKAEMEISKDKKLIAFVQCVADAITPNVSKDAHDGDWEVVLFDSEQINAFALPGGKVAIFTGLLPFTKTEAGLATVMAHEVAHALQRHGAERYSSSILEQIAQIGAIAGAAAGGVNPGVAIGAMSAYGVGVALPNSRKQESEADFIGLQLMAKAGYDPKEAVPFWERMSGCPRKMIGRFCFRSNASVPEFLSTHPSDVTRINQIEAWLPKALQYYHPESVPKSSANETSEAQQESLK